MDTLEAARIGTASLEARRLASLGLSAARIGGLGLEGRRVPLATPGPPVVLGTFETGETWTGTVSTEQAHGGTKSGKLVGIFTDLYRSLVPAVDLSGLSSLDFWTYGHLAVGLGSGNSIDLRAILWSDGGLVEYAQADIPAIITATTQNDQWVSRSLARSSFTTDSGFDWAAVDTIQFELRNEAGLRVKTLYIDDVESPGGEPRRLEARRLASLSLEARRLA